MDRPSSTKTEVLPTIPDGVATASDQRLFNLSMVVSGIRCLLAYIVLPFVTPFLGLAPGVGPVLGIVIGTVAIGANMWSLNRFRASSHRWRKPVIAIHILVIAFLLVLLAIDVSQLVSG